MLLPPKNIYDYVTFRLDRLNDLAKEQASKIYTREFGVSIRELRILRMTDLYPGLNLGQLMALTMIEKTITSKLVSSLCDRGYLTRSVDVADARRLKLELTAEGKTLVEKTYKRGVELEMGFLRSGVLSDEELDTFISCIDKLTTYLQATAEEESGIEQPLPVTTGLFNTS